MKRRELLGAATALTASAGIGLGAIPGAARAAAAATRPGPGPNILFILVDELRFPKVFPAGISSPQGFLAAYMPNLFRLWRSGVKFGQHFTAGTACTPARGCLITGLYTQQSWLAQTVLAKPYTPIAIQPVLSTAYPTYGKLLRQAGYQTPYVGKWHVSIPGPSRTALDPYGFEAMTYYDPTGANLQGTVGDQAHGYLNDEDVAKQAVGYIATRSPGSRPWCLTVSFVNPHDKEFFWAGTEFKRYNALFQNQTTYRPFTLYSTIDDSVSPPKDYFPLVRWTANPLKEPNQYGYPPLPPNWESSRKIARDKPSTQTYTKLFSQAVWGGVADDPQQDRFTITDYPAMPAQGSLPWGVGMAPYSYWQRGLDCYTDTLTIVDQRIGEVLDALQALPRAVRDNTVVVFTSDHGEYAGAHGYISGKVGSAYDEAFHVPLIVSDASGRFTADTGTLRTGLTSSVDLLRLLVTLGNGGSQDWLYGDLATIYGGRLDLSAMLLSAAAPGRDYVLLATDEIVPGYYNFNHSPGHIVALRTAQEKLGLYANWIGVTDQIDTGPSLETEFYDYTTYRGQLEIDNRKGDPRIQPLQDMMVGDIIPNELRARLPGRLAAAQAVAKAQYLAYNHFIAGLSASGFSGGQLRDLLGYGQDF